MMLAEAAGWGTMVVTSGIMFCALAASILVGFRPAVAAIQRHEQRLGRTLSGSLLLRLSPRAVTVASGVVMLVLAVAGYGITGGLIGASLFGAVGMVLPSALVKYLQKARLKRLEGQLVTGIQTLSSGVRAGLNLVQSLQLVAQDGPAPLRDEFAHLVREYEYGLPLEQAMTNAGARIGSGDFELLFAALRTHRERGGDLGETLDRISQSIREIQRLEKRIDTLTAQGRTVARWLTAMPAIVLGIMYVVDSAAVQMVFDTGLGKLILGTIVALNLIARWWIRKIISVDI